jgi:hypothetical protein
LAALVVATGSGVAGAQTVDRQAWLASMRQILPAAFCQDGSYFRDCFTLTPDACNAAANRAAEACIRQFSAQIPARLRQPDDGGVWGQKIGSCAGSLFEVNSMAAKRNSAVCNDPAAWK